MNTPATMTLALLMTAASGAVEERRQWRETFAFDPGVDPLIVVDNIWGPVSVRVHDRPEVVVVADETRSARDAETLERSKELIFIVQDHQPDRLTIVVDGAMRDSRPCDPCPGCRLRLALELRVPPSARIDVGTVMDGSVDVEGVADVHRAANVNGNVTVRGLRRCGQIRSVNGEVVAQFIGRPEQDSCAIETVNGDMTLALPAHSDASFEFDLFNGAIDSEVELDAAPVSARIDKLTRGSKKIYRLSRPLALRLGGGGPRFTFESINGDVHINSNRQE